MKEGYKKTELGCIPEDWEATKLGEISLIKGQYGLNAPAVEYCESKKNYVRITDIDNDGQYKMDGRKSVHPSFVTDDYILKKNDILFARTGGTVGKTYLHSLDNENFVFAGFLIRFRINEKNALPYFIKLQMGTQMYNNWVTKTSMRSGQPGINGKEYCSYRVPLPPLKEQQAIADCLSSWDKAIELQRELILSKEVRKKSLAQQLLTGKRRLPGFTNEWKEQTLGNLGEAYTGLSGKNKDHFGKGKPFITYMNVFSNSTINLSSFPLVEIESNEIQNRVKYGDILFTVSSETPHEAGMAAVFLDDSIKELYLNSFCFGYRLHDFKILLPIFASFILRADVFRKEIYKLAQGSTRFNISKSGVLKINFRIPSIVEQDAIANVLETADKEIQLEKKKLADLQQQKKALMQQLLTGKVRLV